MSLPAYSRIGRFDDPPLWTEGTSMPSIPDTTDSPPSFEAFWDQYRGMIHQICQRALQSGLLEENDIPGEAYLAWEASRHRWNPDLSRFPTFALNNLRYQLAERYPSLYQAPELHGRSENRLALSSSHTVISDSLSDGVPASSASSASPDSEGDFDDPEFLDLAQSQTNLLQAAICAHPVWHHRRYRQVLTAMRDPHGPRTRELFQELARQLGLTERRMRQIGKEILDILANPSLHRDAAIPLKDPVDEDDESAIRFVRLGLIEPPDLVSPAQHQAARRMVRRFLSDQQILVPILIDQHYRILDGWARYSAAASLKLATIPVFTRAVPNSRSTHYDDPLFWRVRRHLARRVRPQAILSSRQIRLF